MKLKRLFRFSLGTFFVLLTMFCIWLGLEVNRVSRENEVAKKITASGGNFQYDYQFDNELNYLPNAVPPSWHAVFGEAFSLEL